MWFKVNVPGAKRQAGINASEAFLAPLIATVPLRRTPPSTINLSMHKDRRQAVAIFALPVRGAVEFNG